MLQFSKDLLLHLCLLIIVVSCSGYHYGVKQGVLNNYSSVSVPYVNGDVDGALTSSIVAEIVRSGVFEYKNCEADLELKIFLREFDDQNIGFRYDRKKRGDLTHSIIPSETRLTAYADISLVDSTSGQVVFGPTPVFANVEFDHDYYSNRGGVNIFSLGQLSDVDAAYDAAILPLNRALAKKIVDCLKDSW